ncbi:hypothetical protein PR048_023802, partial [Dryococelus australis]
MFTVSRVRHECHTNCSRTARQPHTHQCVRCPERDTSAIRTARGLLVNSSLVSVYGVPSETRRPYELIANHSSRADESWVFGGKRKDSLWQYKKCIWDPKHSEYKKNIKEDAWREIGSVMGGSAEEFNLLASFRRERTKVNKSKGTGKGYVKYFQEPLSYICADVLPSKLYDFWKALMSQRSESA